jgi:hypothetical protein
MISRKMRKTSGTDFVTISIVFARPGAGISDGKEEMQVWSV